MPCGLTPRSKRLQFRAENTYLAVMEQFAVSERAAARIAEIIAAESRSGTVPADTPGDAGRDAPPALRVAVLAGGCSGFQYRFELDAEQLADDLVIERAGARVVVDPVSLDLLAGGELDFTDELMGSHFAVRNPNAKSACGCGTSFSVD
jgi:iron-sulfur cluster insertion protein